MRMHLIAGAVVLLGASSGAALAAPVARPECPRCDALRMEARVAADWIAMGDALSDAERYREAVAAYQRSIQLDARVTRTSTRRVARAFALMGNDKQAVRWLEQSLRVGVKADELWSDELFAPYRNEPRLRLMLERAVNLRAPLSTGRHLRSA